MKAKLIFLIISILIVYSLNALAQTCENEGQPCGLCGTTHLLCPSSSYFCNWDSCYYICDGYVLECINQGVCSPGQVQTNSQSCGGGGCGIQYQTRTCASSCQWGGWSGWGSCSLQSGYACFSGQTQAQSCNSDATCGGQQTRTCSSCQWGSWSSCSGGTNCDASNGWYCNSATREYRDYYCSGGGCSYSATSSENCAAKSSADSDGSCSAYTNAGTVTDYVSCSSGTCTTTNYPDYCSGTILTEYCASGSSFSSSSYNCESSETTYCSNGKQYRDEWLCSGSPGACTNAPDTLVGIDADSDGVDQQCQDATCDNSKGICDTAIGACIAKTSTETSCTDSLDNDCDGLTDCNDIDCAGSISGNVKNTQSQNIADAKLEAYQGSVKKHTSYTDAQGNYNINSVMCGTYSIAASAGSYASSTQSNINVPARANVIVNFNNGNSLVEGNICQNDCTHTGDDLIHKECNNINGCQFYDSIAAELCDLSQAGWIKDYSQTHLVECGEGIPYESKEVKATVSCPKENLIKKTRVVNYQGKLVKLYVVVCG